MPSRTPLQYLERKRIFVPHTRHRPRYATNAQKSHSRPIVHAEQLIGPDHVADRVVTEEERKRRPYKGTCCG